MDAFTLPRVLWFVFAVSLKGVWGTTFTFKNHCNFTVWPGMMSNAGSPKLESTGFELPNGESRSYVAPADWSGRFWGRAGCSFDGSENGNCVTGDCTTGEVECKGNGPVPPATLAEFTLGSAGQDFYDVSLVDGFNLPVYVTVDGGRGNCQAIGCIEDLNQRCPIELQVEGGAACKSACEAFRLPEYCCDGEYSSPATCHPTNFSRIFKSACPTSYSYAYDDATSTFTCSGGNYVITFCPADSPSQKSTKDPTKAGDASENRSVAGSVTVAGEGAGEAVMFTDVIGFATAKGSRMSAPAVGASLIPVVHFVIGVILL